MAKIIIIILIIAALAGGGYYFYTSGNATATDASQNPIGSIDQISGPASSGVGDGSTIVGADIVVLLNKVNSLKIDPAIFKTPAYLSLVDYSVQVPAVEVGRANPFAPIPGWEPPVTTKKK